MPDFFTPCLLDPISQTTWSIITTKTHRKTGEPSSRAGLHSAKSGWSAQNLEVSQKVESAAISDINRVNSAVFAEEKLSFLRRDTLHCAAQEFQSESALSNMGSDMRTVSVRPLVLVWVVVSCKSLATADDPQGYNRLVAPFLKTYCAECHAGEKPEGEFGTDAARLPASLSDLATRKKWAEVVNVLNSHQMPPEKSVQPKPDEVAGVVDWITAQAVEAELVQRERTVVLRRLNRSEYRNTIRDLIGVDFDTSGFPEDAAAGGFDNNGSALTMSPLQIELYLNAAQQILDRSFVEGERPEMIRWHFDPRVGPADRVRQRLDERNNPLVNGNNNQEEGDWVIVHHNSWDKSVGVRDFRVPVTGTYVIRIRAAGRRPGRDAVVSSAAAFLKHRQDEQDAKNPKGRKYTQEQYDRDLEHFRTDRMYDYGPPRARLIQQLGSQPRTIAEFDVEESPDEPGVYEFPVRFTTETAGVHIENVYAIPKVLENFWMQGNDKFARPELFIDWIEIEGPIFDAWPPTSHSIVLGNRTGDGGDEAKDAKTILERFMRRAWRRPISEAELAVAMKQFQAARERHEFVDAIKIPLTSVLTSPSFLYLVEPSGDAAGEKLDDYQLASRLSYLLWSSMPDEELSRLAEQGELRNASVRIQQVDRMLKAPKAAAFVRNFAGQWLGLRLVGTNPPAEDLYPQYDRHLETSMVGESEAFFREFLMNDLDARGLIRSDFVTINERLARFYGIQDVRGDQFRRVEVPDGVHRGGIVTQASILTLTSNGTRTSPVKRGTWILKTLLGTDPGLPVANAGEIAPKVPGIDKATVRQRLEIHRELPQCARCHNKIDPLGFALENFNAAGEWRDQEGFGYKGRVQRDDPVINASSRMPDGTEINGVEGLQSAMLTQEDLFLRSLASKLLTYALGREPGLADQPLIQHSVQKMKSEGYTIRSLIHQIVASESFGTH